MHLSAAGNTAPGPRPANEDASFVDLDLGLLIVADGMGGHNAGEVASRMAVDTVVEFIRDTRTSGELTWPFAADLSQSAAANRVSVALRIANRRVHEAGKKNPRHAGMGTTIVAALVDGDCLVVGHVGDSRAYRLRGAELQQMTVDDTWLNVMIAAGTAPKNPDHPLRHVLTRGIGMRPDVSPSVAEVALVRGEHWLICTDGVHGYLDATELQRSFDAPSAMSAAQLTVNAALEAGTSDNVTAVVLYVG